MTVRQIVQAVSEDRAGPLVGEEGRGRPEILLQVADCEERGGHRPAGEKSPGLGEPVGCRLREEAALPGASSPGGDSQAWLNIRD